MDFGDTARRVLDATGSLSEFAFVPYDEVYGQGIEDMYHRVPSTEKIAAATGWHPTLVLEQILRDVIEHVRTAEPEPVRAR